MDLVDLYRKHINPDADGADLMDFFDAFGIGILVTHWDPVVARLERQEYEMRKVAARSWVYKNSKLHSEKISHLRPESPFIC